jgi:hypothetical protein
MAKFPGICIRMVLNKAMAMPSWQDTLLSTGTTLLLPIVSQKFLKRCQHHTCCHFIVIMR